MCIRDSLHPNQLIESPLLAANHPWRLEALAVSDAFESVTNGMEEPGVLEQLQNLEEASLLQPWRHLILAMHFYYENLDEAVVQHLQKIPQNCPISALGRMIQSLLQPPSKGNLTPTLGKLAEQVAQPDPLMLQWVQAVSYTHLDVYKRQGIGSDGLRRQGRMDHFHTFAP